MAMKFKNAFNDRGAALVEYVVLLATLSVALITIILHLSQTMNEGWIDASKNITSEVTAAWTSSVPEDALAGFPGYDPNGATINTGGGGGGGSTWACVPENWTWQASGGSGGGGGYLVQPGLEYYDARSHVTDLSASASTFIEADTLGTQYLYEDPSRCYVIWYCYWFSQEIPGGTVFPPAPGASTC